MQRLESASLRGSDDGHDNQDPDEGHAASSHTSMQHFRRERRGEVANVPRNGSNVATVVATVAPHTRQPQMSNLADRINGVDDGGGGPPPHGAPPTSLSSVAGSNVLLEGHKREMCPDDIDCLWTEDDARMCFGCVPILPERNGECVCLTCLACLACHVLRLQSSLAAACVWTNGFVELMSASSLHPTPSLQRSGSSLR
jgi:hypothetical protein